MHHGFGDRGSLKTGWPTKKNYANVSGSFTHNSPKAPLGSGGRFAALKAKLATRGDVRDPGAVAAAIGRKKFGKKKFQVLAAAGKRG